MARISPVETNNSDISLRRLYAVRIFATIPEISVGSACGAISSQGETGQSIIVQEVWQEEVDQIFKDKQKIVKADHVFYENLIAELQEQLKQLQ